MRRISGASLTIEIGVLVSAVVACHGPQNVVDPAARPIAWSTGFFGPRSSSGLRSLWLRSGRRSAAGAPQARTASQSPSRLTTSRRRHHRIVGALIGATAIVLLVFLVFDFSVGRALVEHPSRALTMEIVGHQWWCEVHYVDPDPSKIGVDANELQIPAAELAVLVFGACVRS